MKLPSYYHHITIILSSYSHIITILLPYEWGESTSITQLFYLGLRVSFGYPSFDPSLWGKHRVLSLVKKARASFSFELKIMGIYCQTHPDCICFAALMGLMGEWSVLLCNHQEGMGQPTKVGSCINLNGYKQ
jgi:hypothetical protein